MSSWLGWRSHRLVRARARARLRWWARVRARTSKTQPDPSPSPNLQVARGDHTAVLASQPDRSADVVHFDPMLQP